MEIRSNYVATGQVKIVYWPMIDFGASSLNSYAAAHCIGLQSSDAFWVAHGIFYEQQSQVWQANSDYFVNVATEVGVDPEAFMSCYDSGEGHGTATLLDGQRRDLGISSRPTFDINGQKLFGNQRYSVFAQAIDLALN